MCFSIFDFNPTAQALSTNVDLTSLLPFGNPPHHSTADHQMSYQGDPRTFVETDGIRHSFDRSMQALDSSELRTLVAVKWRKQATRPDHVVSLEVPPQEEKLSRVFLTGLLNQYSRDFITCTPSACCINRLTASSCWELCYQF